MLDIGRRRMAVSTARDIPKIKHAGETIRSLLVFSQRLASTLDVDQVLEILLGEAVSSTNATGGGAGYRTPEGLVCRRLLHGAEVLATDYRWPLDQGLSGWLVQHKVPYLTDDAVRDGLLDRELCERLSIKRVLAMALLNADGEVIGSVCAFDKADGSPFTDTDRDRLVVLAQTASVALQNAIAHQEVVDLSRRLAGIQEAQRRSIALELHDEIGQALTVLGLQLNYARAATDDPQLRSALDEALATCEATLERVRALSLDLRPPLLDELGLEAALRWYVEHQAQRWGITTRIETDAVGARVSPEIATACFRIAQEGLTNTVRHASAKSVSVSLRLRDDELSLAIEDDGMGFDVPAARERSRKGESLGLLGMQDRAMLTGGRLDIASAPGRGTRICARWRLTPRPFAGGPRGRL